MHHLDLRSGTNPDMTKLLPVIRRCRVARDPFD